MIRAVLDTNVLASAAGNFYVQDNVPAALLHAAIVRRFQHHYQHGDPGGITPNLAETILSKSATGTGSQEIERIITRWAQPVPITVQVTGVAPHREDDPILATAASARVDYLVTGDKRLRKHVSSFSGIPLISPAEFLHVLTQES
jgi:predicted nucleic acid-binding protein